MLNLKNIKQNFLFQVKSVIFLLLGSFVFLNSAGNKDYLLGSKYFENMGKYNYKIEQLNAKRENRKNFREERPKIRHKLDKLKEKSILLDTKSSNKDKRDKRVIEIIKELEHKDSELKNVEKLLKQVEDQTQQDNSKSNLISSLLNDKEKLESQLKQLKNSVADLANFKAALENPNGEKAQQLLADIKQEIQETELELKYINTELAGGNIGDIILRGIAGNKNWELIEDLSVGNNVLEGIGKGVMLRTSISTGNAIGGIIDEYVKTLFATTFGKFESFISFLYRVIFHSSCRPYTVEELGYWKDLISKDFREIEMMIKSAEKLDSRGKADILREYENEQESESPTLNLWRDFVEDHAFTYEELAQEIELRKGYYDKNENGFGIVNCADRLISKLLKIKDWLLSVKTLRDFANIPEAKSIIPAMRKSIENYFENLANQIKPLNTKKGGKINIGDNGFSKKDHWGNGFGDDSSYPGFVTE